MGTKHRVISLLGVDAFEELIDPRGLAEYWRPVAEPWVP